MRVLYICGTYAPGAFAGSELSAHTLLKRLVLQHGVDVLVASDIRYTDHRNRSTFYDGIEIVGIRQQYLGDEITETIMRFGPDIIYTQPSWHDIALRLGRELGIPTVLRVVDWPIPQSVFEDHGVRPDAVVVQTKEVAEAIARWKIRTALLPAFIDLERAKSPHVKRREFITMFNPVKEKGGFLFRSIVERMPLRAFAVVPGWASLRDSQGRFDPELFRRILASHGVQHKGWLPEFLLRALESRGFQRKGLLPEEPDFSGLKNIRVLEPRDEVWEIYDQTRILLVPSLWKEQFGRVIFEAAANGAAVIASGMDSLRQNAGEAAAFVEDYRNVDAWIDAISKLDEPARYAERCKEGQDFVKRTYDLAACVEQVYALMYDLAEGAMPLHA